MDLLPEHMKKPPKYIWACILCSVNGLLFGMDTGIIGPVTDMKIFKASFGGSQNATIHGLIVSSILVPAAFSSFFAGYLADRLGRPRGISIGVFIFGVGAAIEAGAVSLGMFIAGRVVEGLGEGLFLGNLVVLICEISPTSTRGPLTTGPQLLITLGLVVGFFTCYGSSTIQSSLSWRTPFILLSSLSMILCATSFFYLPESPRWLTLHGRHKEAAETWDNLEVSQAEREKVELQSETTEVVTPVPTVASVKVNTVHKLLDIFSKDVRTRTALAVFLMGMQQMSGIDGVLYVR
jgi:MFS family permease